MWSRLVFFSVVYWFTLLTPVFAQLNENCTVSILNRTANVKPDGNWRIDNVPANFGQVRARATCVENGVTLSGQSDFIIIEQDIVNGFNAEIPLGVVDPIPESLTISVPTTTLTAVGAATQLTVTATFPGGTTQDVTAGISGSNYTISNPAVATVSPDGLVTAVSSGTVLVSATNEGALGVTQIQVVLSGDSDGDGIPDDVELANGLDPNNPVDALEDFDNDGLTNKEELVDFGTDLQVADTDGDGINDGEEVVAGADGFITNPLLADTDGDGIRDGLEIATGSDPTDPGSFNLAQALASLDVNPASIVLTVNTIIGEASQQLTVTGTLTDGTTIDLTSAAKGTNYSSSDLFICNFGVPDGRVFAGSDGSCAVTATNSGFSDTASVIVRTFTPTAISHLDLPGFANNVDVQGDFVYVAAGPRGLHVIDVADREQPFLKSTLPLTGNANDVKVKSTLAFVAGGSSGLHIVDISDPQNPLLLKTVDTPGDAIDLVVAGDTVFVADGSAGVQVITVQDVSNATIIGSLDTLGTANGLDVGGEILVVSNFLSPVDIIDISTPANPQPLSTVNLGSGIQSFDVQLLPPLAYVATSSDLRVIDFTDPVLPQNLGAFGASIWMTDLILAQNNFLLTTHVRPDTPMPIFDVSSPESPAFIGNIIFSSLGVGLGDGTGLAVDAQFIYMTASAGFEVAFKPGVSGDTRLYIGQYLSIEDMAGIPPTASITSPASGGTVLEESSIPITVEATDDVAVEAVDFIVDGQVVFTDTKTPYQFNFAVPVGVTSLTLDATAIDFGGNVGVAESVVVNVIPDPLTTATGKVVDRDGNPVAGATVTCLNVSGLTGVDGTFSISGVPTVQGDVMCNVAFVTSGGETLVGTVPAVAPVAGGTTNISDIVLIPPFLYPGPKFSTGIGPTSVTVADLNGDNTPDIVTANEFSDDISVLLGNGDGAFQTEQRFAVGNSPESVAVAELNGDGAPDIVTANEFSDDISVLLGNGDGTFQTEQRFALAVDSGPASVAVADLNGDGAPDIVTANEFSDDISVLLGNGDGTFQTEQRFALAVDSGPASVAVADLNGDGAPDIVTANGFSDNVSVLLGNGDGTFQTELRITLGNNSPFSKPVSVLRSVLAVDVNSDGAPDIVVANRFSGNVSVLLGNGDGTFQAQRLFAVGDGPLMVLAVDVNADGISDLVTANDFSNDVSVLLGNGDGTFQAQQRIPVNGGNTISVAAADMNGDGVLDIVTANGFSDTVSVFLGNGDGTFRIQLPFAVGDSPDSVAVGDLNGDGALDLVTANSFSNDVSVLLGNGDVTFQVQQRFAAFSIPGSVLAADLNGDGTLDLVTTTFPRGVLVLLGNGDGTFQARLLFSAGEAPGSVVAADLNADGAPDLVTANKRSDDVSVLLGNGDGTFQTEQRFSAGEAPGSVVAADLNADGAPDLVTANKRSDDVSVLLGNGDGTFQFNQRFAAGNFPTSVVAADVNGDGIPDLVTSNAGGGNDVSVLLGNGDGTFQTEQRFSVSSGPSWVTVADLNGDGAPDIVTANGSSDDISVLLGNGDGTFQTEQRFAVGGSPDSVAVGDLNGDGAPDLVTANRLSDDVSVLLGNGDGTFQSPQRFAVGNSPSSVLVVDLNGDGGLDLVTANNFSDDVSVLLHR